MKQGEWDLSLFLKHAGHKICPLDLCVVAENEAVDLGRHSATPTYYLVKLKRVLEFVELEDRLPEVPFQGAGIPDLKINPGIQCFSRTHRFRIAKIEELPKIILTLRDQFANHVDSFNRIHALSGLDRC